MSSEDWAIRLEHVSKVYPMAGAGRRRAGASLMAGGPKDRSAGLSNGFAAVCDVSLDVRKGQTVGIVGRNGSGKSTLLQIVCGTIRPSSGQVSTSGKIAALLELGAGFNAEFTGRQNVLLNAAIHGMSRSEALGKLDAIIEFADIGAFIDQPVKTYSSGMYVRLAFASAINTDSEILIVDEALAVGDEAFQRKCFSRLKRFQAEGKTVLFVSHSVQSVIELCDHAVLMDGGEKLLEGDPKAVTAFYQRLVHAPADRVPGLRQALREMATVEAGDIPTSRHGAGAAAGQASPAAAKDRLPQSFEAHDPGLEPVSKLEYAEKGARLSGVQITNLSGAPCNILDHGKRYRFGYRVEFLQPRQQVVFAMMVKTVRGLEVFGQWSAELGDGESVEAGEVVEVVFEFDNCLLPGTYFCNAGIFSGESGEFDILHRVVDAGMFKVAPHEFPNHMRGLVSALYPGARTGAVPGDQGAAQAKVQIRRPGLDTADLPESQYTE